MYRSTFFFTSALVGGELSASRPCHFTPAERTLGTHWIGWVDRVAGLNNIAKLNSLPYRSSNFDSSVIQPVASRSSGYATAVLQHKKPGAWVPEQSDRRLSAKLVPTFAVRRVPRGRPNGSLRPYTRFFRPEPLLFLSSSSSIVLTRLSGPRSRPTTSQKIW
jgi:hypothetical protein